MSQVLEDLRNIGQGEAKVEEEYPKRLNEAIFRFVNVHSKDEKIIFYMDCLLETIRTVVASYRERVHLLELTFEGLVHFAKFEDEAHRARERNFMQGKAEHNLTNAPRHPSQSTPNNCKEGEQRSQPHLANEIGSAPFRQNTCVVRGRQSHFRCDLPRQNTRNK